jgi:SAM-dependent methyltransferase
MTPEPLLDDQYWSERYANQQTGWDIGAISNPLKVYFDQLEDKSVSMLIPGCGNAHEAAYLLEKGFVNITLIDISKTLTEQLRIKFKNFCEEGSCRIIHQDFFMHKGSYDLIIEQTFFCALDPSRREEYVRKMSDLLKPGGKLSGLLFNHHFPDGPPFGGDKEEYQQLFRPYFNLKTLETCHNSIYQRFGAEFFINFERKETGS